MATTVRTGFWKLEGATGLLTEQDRFKPKAQRTAVVESKRIKDFFIELSLRCACGSLSFKPQSRSDGKENPASLVASRTAVNGQLAELARQPLELVEAGPPLIGPCRERKIGR